MRAISHLCHAWRSSLEDAVAFTNAASLCCNRELPGWNEAEDFSDVTEESKQDGIDRSTDTVHVITNWALAMWYLTMSIVAIAWLRTLILFLERLVHGQFASFSVVVVLVCSRKIALVRQGGPLESLWFSRASSPYPSTVLRMSYSSWNNAYTFRHMGNSVVFCSTFHEADAEWFIPYCG